MHNDWYRQGNYFKKIDASGSTATNMVAFKNYALIISVKAIEVIRYNDGVIRLYIEASPLHQNTIYDVVKKYFPTFIIDKMSRKTTIISFKPTDNIKVVFDSLVGMFNYFNEKYQRVEFTGDLLKELSNILSWTVLPCQLMQLQAIL